MYLQDLSKKIMETKGKKYPHLDVPTWDTLYIYKAISPLLPKQMFLAFHKFSLNPPICQFSQKIAMSICLFFRLPFCPLLWDREPHGLETSKSISLKLQNIFLKAGTIFGFRFVMPFFVIRLVSSNIFFRCCFIASRGFNINIVLTNIAIESRQVKDDR